MSANRRLFPLLPLLLCGAPAFAQAVFGPAGTPPDCPSGALQTSAACPETPGPCFGAAGCSTQAVEAFGDFLVVRLTLADGYAQAGIAGPCWTGECPDLENQARAEAELKLKNALRHRRWLLR